MNIQEVVDGLRMKGYYARPNWPNITYIFLDGEIIFYSHLRIDKPWMPSHLDLMATDWVEVIPER